MTEPREADEIRHQMADIRNCLHQDVQEIVDNARDMTNWRYYVRRYPWAAVGTAAALGYFVVPRRTKVVSQDADAIADRLSAEYRSAMAGDAQPHKKKTLVGEGFNFVANLAVRGLLSYAAQQAGKHFGIATAEQQEEESQSRGRVPR